MAIIEQFEKGINPNANELMLVNREIKAVIIDAELDQIECEFHYDECVQINTEHVIYITLTIRNLKTLISLIKKSEKLFEDMKDFDWEVTNDNTENKSSEVINDNIEDKKIQD
ncbi:MAG: hypothetical protein ACOVNU_02820 [Candidatus Kapaibacteriota bacterium]